MEGGRTINNETSMYRSGNYSWIRNSSPGVVQTKVIAFIYQR